MAMEPGKVDRKTLESQDGRDGRPSLVLVEGRVYDVSGSRLWKNGTHMNLHRAGQDLTDHVPMAPHGMEVFERVPLMGPIASPTEVEVEEDRLKATLSALYRKVHPHPISIHFPIALFIFAAFLDVLYLILDRPESLGASVLYAQLFGAAVAPVAISTGFLSWWLNYNSTLTDIFRKKIVGSLFLLLFATITLLLRLLDPNVAAGSGTTSVVYHALVIGAWPLVAFIGYQGGKITFPS